MLWDDKIPSELLMAFVFQTPGMLTKNRFITKCQKRDAFYLNLVFVYKNLKECISHKIDEMFLLKNTDTNIHSPQKYILLMKHKSHVFTQFVSGTVVCLNFMHSM
jgi:hypothetical protein